jgi:hypothetical protein
MGRIRAAIDEAAKNFIEAQHMFFVASAPLDANGHINLSPKGLDSFRILSESTVAYLDLTGSGIETVAHVKENGRIILMFCAFDGPPCILRLHGRARVIEPKDTEFEPLAAQFPQYDSVRSIIVVEITRVANTCGFGVPLMKHDANRPHMRDWAQRKGPAGLEAYRKEKNARSIDGLPGLSE